MTLEAVGRGSDRRASFLSSRLLPLTLGVEGDGKGGEQKSHRGVLPDSASGLGSPPAPSTPRALPARPHSGTSAPQPQTDFQELDV